MIRRQCLGCGPGVHLALERVQLAQALDDGSGAFDVPAVALGEDAWSSDSAVAPVTSACRMSPLFSTIERVTLADIAATSRGSSDNGRGADDLADARLGVDQVVERPPAPASF